MKKISNHFDCPDCGTKKSISIIKVDELNIVSCYNCDVKMEIPQNGKGYLQEKVDIFSEFIDVFYADPEIYRLEAEINKQRKENRWKDAIISSGVLSDLYRKKIQKANHDIYKSDEMLTEEIDELKEKIESWESKAEEYTKLQKEIVDKLEKEELEEGVLETIKRERSLEEVFEDPGFLEF